MKIKVFTSFSGYDSQCMALDRLKELHPEFGYELVGWSEIDKYAIQAHNAIYPQWAERNYGDISKIDWSQVPDFDLFTMSSPCQDFSMAGMRRGGEEDSGTRSSLLWECRKAILEKKPKYIFFENVKGLLTKNFVDGFKRWQTELEEYGYNNYWQVVCPSKHCNVPQHRERVFMVSILREVDSGYSFPTEMPLTKTFAEYLLDDVDEKYYINQDKVDRLVSRLNPKMLEEYGIEIPKADKDNI